MTNWKSTVAFFVFVGIYVYTIYTKQNAVVEVTGYIALYSSMLMMFRSNFTTGMLDKMVTGVTSRLSK